MLIQYDLLWVSTVLMRIAPDLRRWWFLTGVTVGKKTAEKNHIQTHTVGCHRNTNANGYNGESSGENII